MPTQDFYRRRFADDALATASPARIVVMAYDRLECDLTGAIDALGNGDTETAHKLLTHAQDLVDELRMMLDIDKWEHAPGLASIYEFVSQLLLRANIAKQTQPVAEARRLLAELGGAFRQAAIETAAAPARAAAASNPAAFGTFADSGDGDRPSGFSLRA